MTTQPASVATDREIVQERVFDAPPALVYQAWTDPGHVGFWFGPKGFTTTTHAIDVHVGGGWHFTCTRRTGRSTRTTSATRA